jgi:exopolysaccharide production protein ExoQ
MSIQPTTIGFTTSKNGPAFPLLSHLRGTLSVTVTFILLAYSFSMIPILLFYMIWLPLIYYKGSFIPIISKGTFLVSSFGFFCLLSSLWSYYPSLTAHHALEFTSMLLCAIIMARIVHPKDFIRGLIIGSIIVLIPALLSERIFELFGSKNQVGFVAEIGFITSFLYLFSDEKRTLRLPLSLFSLMICALALIISRSAASDVTCVAVLGIICITYFVSKLSVGARIPVFILSVLILSSLLYLGFVEGGQSIILHEFNKDSTLSGRTYLWGEGFKIGLENPMLGRGLNAFWVAGEPQAEKYWYEFDIENKTGFHFHNLFIQSFVDLGAVGLVFIVSFIFLNVYKSFHNAFRKKVNLYAMTSLALALMLLLRSLVEVDCLGPFSNGDLLFYSIIPMLQAERRRNYQPQKDLIDSQAH